MNFFSEMETFQMALEAGGCGEFLGRPASIVISSIEAKQLRVTKVRGA